MGYIPTSCLTKISNLDNEQISGLKYNEKEKNYSGLIRMKNNICSFVNLDSDWVDQNFEKNFIELVKEEAKKGNKRYKRLPAGCTRGVRSDIHHVDEAPIIMYEQLSGERSCVLKATGSALYYLGGKKMASDVFNRSHQGEYWLYNLEYVKSVIKRERYRGFELNKLPKGFDPVINSNQYWLSVFVLHGSDGKMDHAVAIAKGWVFDPGYKRALPLSKSTLDGCCSTKEVQCLFIGCKQGFVVVRTSVEVKQRKKKG